MTRSLVTGGAGFIGSNLVDALLARGDAVFVLDDLSSGRRANLDGAATLIEGSVTEPGLVGETVSALAPDSIFHLAAQVDVRKAVDDPGFDAEVNVVGTINVLEAAAAGGVGQFVFTSTGGAIYGEGRERQLPFDESASAMPESAYGTSKLACEHYLGLYRRTRGLNGVALRLGNVYGPRQDPDGEAGVVAIFSGALHDGRALTVFGDGEQTRDYVYVGDVVDALIATRDALASAGDRIEGPYNVGTGVETTVLELAGYLGEAAGRAEVEHQPARMGEVQRAAIDPAAARRDLGWVARTELRSGLARTYEWLAAER